MKVGDKAPEILGKDENGKDIFLSDYKGRKLVLYFYPKDNTSGCTAEACSLRDRYGELQGAGYEVVGVSKDSASSHQKFKEKHALPFPLIADVDKKLLEEMGAWGEKTMYGKKTMGTRTASSSKSLLASRSTPRNMLLRYWINNAKRN